MKIVKTNILLLLYLVAMLRPVAPLIEYYAHQDYIASVLCINKEVKVLDCKGMCYLQKKLEQQEKGVQGMEISIKDYPLGLINHLTEKLSVSISDFLTHNYFYTCAAPKAWQTPIFHPPTC